MPLALWRCVASLSVAVFCCMADTSAQSVSKKLDRYFSTLYDNTDFNGNVLVAERGKIVYERSFGYADFQSRKQNDVDARFGIASITKVFTATAILQLQEQHLLDVNRPVSDYLPRFPYPTVTLRHLLSHTSGVPPYEDVFDTLRARYPDSSFTNKDILPRYAALKLPLLFSPGDGGDYSNTNFVFLALMVEKVSGMPYHEYLRKHIFEPAGMRSTFFPTYIFYNYSPEEKKNLALLYRHPHVYDDTVEETDTIGQLSNYGRSYNFQGFAEIITTARDMLRFDQALYGDKLLRQSTLAKAFAPVSLNGGAKNPVGNGLGWKIADDTTFGKLVMHEGGLIGVTSFFLRNVSRRQTIIIFDNTQKRVAPMAEAALQILNGQEVSLPRKSMARIYGRVVLTSGLHAAADTLALLEKDAQHYLLSENEMNALGYDFIHAGNDTAAMQTFRINVQTFPASWNVYDSYGEVLLRTGNKDEAIKMYRRSLELNPNNENAKQVLQKIASGG